MICISVQQTSGGRTGHKMKDYLTAYCISFIFGWRIVYNSSWNFPIGDHDNHVNMFNIKDESLSPKQVPPKNIVYSFQSWNGMDMNSLQRIKKEAENHNTDVVVVLKNATRVLPNQIYNWGYKEEYFNMISHLRELYNSSPFKPVKRFIAKLTDFTITIHIRKGDVHNRIMHNFDHKNIDYYVNIIHQLSKNISCYHVINIISEKWIDYDEKDVRSLENINVEKNTKINVILDYCIYEYFTDFIESDILVLTNGQGSFSDMALIYSKPSAKIILCPEYRQFEYTDNLDNRIIFANKKGDFDSHQLYN